MSSVFCSHCFGRSWSFGCKHGRPWPRSGETVVQGPNRLQKKRECHRQKTVKAGGRLAEVTVKSVSIVFACQRYAEKVKK